MFNKRYPAAQRVAKELNGIEDAVDDLMIKLGEFVATLPRERRNAALSPMVGHEACTALSRAVALSGQLRHAVMETHIALAAAQQEAGLRTYAFGTCTEKPVQGAHEEGLRAVS